MSETTTPQTGVEQPSDENRVLAILSRQDNEQPEEAQETAAVPQQPQETAPVEQAQTDELTAEDLPDDQSEAPSVSGDEFEIVHNGQPRKLSREETIRLAQQGFDYTQKTQALADQARSVSERMQRLAEVEQVQGMLLEEHATVKALESQLQRFNNVDWVRLATDDPLEYPKVRAQYDMLAQAYSAARQQYSQKAEAVGTQMGRIRADMLRQEAAQLPKVVPAWSDPAKFAAARDEMTQYLSSVGLNPQEVSAKYLDSAFAMKTLWQSMQYEKLQKAKSEKVKALRTASPMVKPGATQASSTRSAERERDARARLKKSGSLEDAAMLLLNRGKR